MISCLLDSFTGASRVYFASPDSYFLCASSPEYCKRRVVDITIEHKFFCVLVKVVLQSGPFRIQNSFFNFK